MPARSVAGENNAAASGKFSARSRSEIISANANVPPAESPGLAVTYVGYSFFAVVSFFFVRALVHETRGRELEDMQG